MELCNIEKCTGCLACVNTCKYGAISVFIDKEGFQRPRIDKSKCKECGSCVKSCPIINKVTRNSFEKKVYACWLKNSKKRRESTSGGAFSAIAEIFLRQNGIVYGAAYKDDLSVEHTYITEIDKLKSLMGSKYVQSNIGLSYRAVKKELSKGKKICFSGTPCQVAGLYAYLGKRYEEQLLTIDLVCHGVPSPMIYREYLEYIENKKGKKVKKISFRDKKWSWFNFNVRIQFEDGTVVNEVSQHNQFMRGFLNEWFLRPSCHSCEFANVDRISDITLADFWWYKSKGKEDVDTDEGISMVMINSEVGEKIFNQIENMFMFESDVETAAKSNRALREPFPPNPNRNQFWTDFYEKGFDGVIDTYMLPEHLNRSNTSRYIDRHYGTLPRIIRTFIKLLYIISNRFW